MNYLIFLFTIYFAISCSAQQKKMENQEALKSYNVYQIDSLDNYYIVYAKKGKSIFKIVSKNEKSDSCNIIKTKNDYLFHLYSQSSTPLITGEIITPVSIYDVVCHTFEYGTKICTDRKNGVYDLYYTRNLKGLCYEN